MKQAKKHIYSIKTLLFLGFALSMCNNFQAQEIKSSADTTQIKIGEQIKYRIQVQAAKDAQIVFPEGQSFIPLELVEAYEIDTTQLSNKKNYKLTREYALTQFDSGSYTIPRQKILLNGQTFFTDSIQVEVANVEVDTLAQEIFPIKPTIEIKKPSSFPMWILWTLLTLALVALLVFLFLKLRKRRLERKKEIPPYEKAMDTLKKLDESQTLERGEMKAYYSTLTLAVKRYIDEKIDERALESTTEELLLHLQELKNQKHYELNPKVIKDLEEILRRADLIKFAGAGMDKLTAKADRKLIEEDINSIKESIPEPTEEELLEDEIYREEKRKKAKKKKIIAISVGTVLVLLIVNFTFFGTKSFEYVKDLVVYDSAEELLEKDWVGSQYGYPSVFMLTPKVLIREEVDPKKVPPQILSGNQATLAGESFSYGKIEDELYVNVFTINMEYLNGTLGFGKDEDLGENEADKLAEQGAKNIIFKQDKFTTADGSEGAKVYGSFIIENPVTKQEEKKNYVHLYFTSDQGNVTIFVSNKAEDEGFEEINNRIMNAIEFNKES
jgi:hypothetical protein